MFQLWSFVVVLSKWKNKQTTTQKPKDKNIFKKKQKKNEYLREIWGMVLPERKKKRRKKWRGKYAIPKAYEARFYPTNQKRNILKNY